MANYKGIKGFQVQTRSTDSTTIGDFYYNSGSGTFKVVKDGGPPIGTWASGANVNTARMSMGSCGIKTAGMIMGGDDGPARVALTETYDGTAWTERGDLNLARGQNGGAGTTSAAITFAGIAPTVSPAVQRPETESWNGSAWSEVNDLNTGRYVPAGFGISTTAICAGGTDDSSDLAITESWNGTSWTEVNNLNTARRYIRGSGPSTDGLVAGGSAGGSVANVESWNGTSWTETTDINSARSATGAVGSSSSNSLIYGGQSPASALTEAWNGTAWTEVADLAAARLEPGSSGANNTSAICATGGTPTRTAVTEEWSADAYQIKTVTTS